MPRRGAPWFGSLVRLIVGGVGLAAGLIKLPPFGSSTTVGDLLPVVEVVLGAILVLRLVDQVRWRRASHLPRPRRLAGSSSSRPASPSRKLSNVEDQS